MRRGITGIVVVLAVYSQAAMADSSGMCSSVTGACPCAASTGRVLHLPKEQPIGEVCVLDQDFVVPEISREFHPGYVFVQP
jgi:hypothetical protein